MNDFVFRASFWFLVGAGFATLIFSISVRHSLIGPCEAELPRGQYCKLIAVPLRGGSDELYSRKD